MNLFPIKVNRAQAITKNIRMLRICLVDFRMLATVLLYSFEYKNIGTMIFQNSMSVSKRNAKITGPNKSGEPQ